MENKKMTNEFEAICGLIGGFMKQNRKDYIVYSVKKAQKEKELEKETDEEKRKDILRKIKEFDREIEIILNCLDIERDKVNAITAMAVTLLTKEGEKPANPRYSYIKAWDEIIKDIFDGKKTLRDFNKEEE